MKNLKFAILALFIVTSCKTAQTEPVKIQEQSCLDLNAGDLYLKNEFQTRHIITSIEPSTSIILTLNEKHLELNFEGDSLQVSGNMKLSTGAKLFIDECQMYFRNRIDSLEKQVDFLKKHR